MSKILTYTLLFSSVIICSCSSIPPQKEDEVDNSFRESLRDTIVPRDPLFCMRIECEKAETVATKLVFFLNYLDKEKLFIPTIYLTPQAATQVCKTEAPMESICSVDIPLGNCIRFFCEYYGLQYKIANNCILIDTPKNITIDREGSPKTRTPHHAGISEE